MEDLQDALQSILSDPEQMARVAALAESLGLKQPDGLQQGEPLQTGHSEQREESVPQEAPTSDAHPGGQRKESKQFASIPFFDPTTQDFGSLMRLLSAAGGSETRLLSALRPTLSAAGQNRVDRALRAARLSRLAGALLTRGGQGNV